MSDSEEPSSIKDKIKDKLSTAAEKANATQATIKTQIKSAVRKTNDTLGDLEERWQPVQKKINETKETVSAEYDRVLGSAGYAVEAYKRRHEFGPLAVGATAATFGGYAAIRRRSVLPAAASAVVAGGCMYGLIYGLDEFDIDNYWKRSS